MIKFRMPLLAVRDVEISKKFYHDLFDQEVVLDLGGNVTFSGGFSVQQDFDRLTGVPKSTILHQSHNMELYFEVDDFDAFSVSLWSTSHFACWTRAVPWRKPPRSSITRLILWSNAERV